MKSVECAKPRALSKCLVVWPLGLSSNCPSPLLFHLTALWYPSTLLAPCKLKAPWGPRLQSQLQALHIPCSHLLPLPASMPLNCRSCFLYSKGPILCSTPSLFSIQTAASLKLLPIFMDPFICHWNKKRMFFIVFHMKNFFSWLTTLYSDTSFWKQQVYLMAILIV